MALTSCFLLHSATDDMAPAPASKPSDNLTDSIFGGGTAAGGAAGGGGGAPSARVASEPVDENAELHAFSENQWNPIGGMYYWKNSKNRECVTVMINLNTGSAWSTSENLSIGITPGGMELWVETIFPRSMTSWKKAKRMYTAAHKLHPDHSRRSIAHEDYLKQLVGKEGNEKYSKAHIELPFHVIESTRIEKDLMGSNDDGTRVLHIYLESFEEPTFEQDTVVDVNFID